ncbi:uncharacterized protein LOC132264041 [Phlebotomus argentipes]|uniref:uncharacterized protein LOC132264041 n=1 Tax=Phlebotomus argentipes TaxID=94469 RepID=UPI002892EB7C|nr:uncharacterized protein LOC132264041 [Phlebotomus argentipes]
MRNFVILTFFIVTATTVSAFYVPNESLSDDPGTGDVLDPELDPETQFNDGDQLILVRNKRARFDSFYGASVDSGESRNQLYYQPLFRYRQTKKKRRRLFVPNLWG